MSAWVSGDATERVWIASSIKKLETKRDTENPNDQQVNHIWMNVPRGWQAFPLQFMDAYTFDQIGQRKVGDRTPTNPSCHRYLMEGWHNWTSSTPVCWWPSPLPFAFKFEYEVRRKALVV